MRGATLKHRRGKKEMKQDQKDHFAGMAEHCLRKWGVDTKGSVMSDDGSTHKANT